MLYHLGITKHPTRPAWLVLQVRESLDCLSPETLLYLGEWETTKRRLRQARARRGILNNLVTPRLHLVYQKLVLDDGRAP